MFNVGDEVEIFQDPYHHYDFSKVGSYGVIIAPENHYGAVRVQFSFVNNPLWDGFPISLNIKSRDLALRKAGDKSEVVLRKIRSMYARQYRKTGQCCFL